jgi:hypothetical protein
VHKWHIQGKEVVRWLREYRATPTPEKHFFFFATLFFVFVIATVLGTFWVVFLIVNGILIVPGAWLNPTLRRFVDGKIRQLREQRKVKEE